MWVALTISPKSADIDVKTLYDIYYKRYISKIKVKFILYPETDLKGRLHYHGVIDRSEDNIKDYNWSVKLLTNWCHICLKEIRSLGNWIKYCKKEFKITKKVLKVKEPITDTVMTGITLFDYPEFMIE